VIDENYKLQARCDEFTMVIDKSICTDRHGQLLELEAGLSKIIQQLIYRKEGGGKVYLIGNGGSAAVASHAIPDFIKACGIAAFTLHESSLMTCMSNDLGYDQAFARILNVVFSPQDILIAISSSGNSENICNAVKMAIDIGGGVFTLSGFKPDNTLRNLGDLNIWLDACDYGLVEIGHLFILHNIADRISADLKKMELKCASHHTQRKKTRSPEGWK